MGYIKVLLHIIYLKSDLVEGSFRVEVCKELPIPGIYFILGNDIGGGKVCILEVSNDLRIIENGDDSVFLACVLTRAQAKKIEDAIPLSDSFLTTESVPMSNAPEDVTRVSGSRIAETRPIVTVSRSQLISAQKADPQLVKYFALVETADKSNPMSISCFIDNGVLMRKWSRDLDTVNQIELPVEY